MWGLHSGAADDSSLLGCYDVLTGKQLPTFQGIAVSSSSESSSWRLLVNEVEGTTILQNISNYLAVNTV
jgi:hypothetical protein